MNGNVRRPVCVQLMVFVFPIADCMWYTVIVFVTFFVDIISLAQKPSVAVVISELRWGCK